MFTPFSKEELIQKRIASGLTYQRLDPIMGFPEGTYEALENGLIAQTIDHFWLIHETRLLNELGYPIFQ